jgi:hypothetical protein
MRASGLSEPQLTVSYLARDRGLLLPDAGALDYTVLLTIRAPHGVELYNATRLQYRVLDPITAQLPLRIRP